MTPSAPHPLASLHLWIPLALLRLVGCHAEPSTLEDDDRRAVQEVLATGARVAEIEDARPYLECQRRAGEDLATCFGPGAPSEERMRRCQPRHEAALNACATRFAEAHRALVGAGVLP